MVLFDTTFLSHVFVEGARSVIDPQSGQEVPRAQERIRFLVKTLEEGDEKIVIPTPVLGEFLVFAREAGSEYLNELGRSSCFRIVAFDQRAAVEAAAHEIVDRDSGDKKGGSKAPWQKVKFDRQIVAIGKVLDVHTIYTDDSDLKTLCKSRHIQVKGVLDLELAPEDKQGALAFNEEFQKEIN